MESWYSRNKILIPWTLLGFQLAVPIGLWLYNFKAGRDQDTRIAPSPKETLLPKLSEAEAAALPYPPDAYPNARDVTSPYGSLRVYEWGPEDGRKVILIHGISNPCVALGAIAHGLVDRGCRVILYDLPGKGYSSTPVPTQHSARLYTTTILLAITSSPISWTGNGSTFSLIGYSLGGGIAANFTSYFPSLISSLVLLAPAGLLREGRVTLKNRLLYHSGLLSDTRVENIVRRRLLRGDPPSKSQSNPAEAPVIAELPGEKPENVPQAPILSRMRPGITISNVVAWQIDVHQGYVKSYISSIRYGPVTNQYSDWQRIGERLSAQNASSMERYAEEGLQNGKVLIMGGRKDALIVEEELVPDAIKALGVNNVEFEFVDAGHDLPVTKSDEIIDCIWRFWQGE